MVNHEELSAVVRDYALELVKNAANNSKQSSPEQLAQVIADISVFAAEECSRRQNT